MARLARTRSSDWTREVDLNRNDHVSVQNNFRALTGDGWIKGIHYARATVNVGSLADGAGSTSSVHVKGLALGDPIIAALDVDLVDMTVTAYCQAADTAEVRIQNESGSGPVDLANANVNLIWFDVT